MSNTPKLPIEVTFHGQVIGRGHTLADAAYHAARELGARKAEAGESHSGERVYLAVRHIAPAGGELANLTDPVVAYVVIGRDVVLAVLREARENGDVEHSLAASPAVRLTDKNRYKGREVNFGYAGGGPGNLLTAFRDDFFANNGCTTAEIANVIHSAFADKMSFDVIGHSSERRASDTRLVDAGFTDFGTHYIAYPKNHSTSARGVSDVLVLPENDVRLAITLACLSSSQEGATALASALRHARSSIASNSQNAAYLSKALCDVSTLSREQSDEVVQRAFEIAQCH